MDRRSFGGIVACLALMLTAMACSKEAPPPKSEKKADAPKPPEVVTVKIG